MVFLVPFVYLFVCMLGALLMHTSRNLKYWQLLILNLALTPIGAWLIAVFIRPRPRAYCMVQYHVFEVGRSYGYKKTKHRGKTVYEVYNDKVYRLQPATFFQYFSEVSADDASSRSIISERNLDTDR